MAASLFDSTIASSTGQARDFIGNILKSATEFSIIGKDLEGKIILWNEGARRLYGDEPEEVVGKANSSILHMPEDVKTGRHMEIVQAALRVRKNDQRFSARDVSGRKQAEVKQHADGSQARCEARPIAL